MKISKKIKRDFLAYVRFQAVANGFMPWSVPLVEDNRDAESAMVCFATIESFGTEVLACAEPVLLRAALEGKALLNFHISDLWVFSVSDALQFSSSAAWCCMDELRTAFPWLPEWVWRNIWHQVTNGHEFEYLHPYIEMDVRIFGTQEFIPVI
jgi:hypothetical protein